MGVSSKNNEHRRMFKDVSRSLDLLAADTPTTVGANFIPGKTGETIFIQQIHVHVRTAAAQAISFIDDGSVAREIAFLPASAIVGPAHVLIDSAEGVACQEGANLDITGTAGVEATIYITAYRRLTGVVTPAQLAAAT